MIEAMGSSIIEKLNRHMASPPQKESDVVYALVEVRKLLEQTGEKETFSRLTFFCDWVVHPLLDKKNAQNVLLELDGRLGGYDASRPWEIDPDGQVHDLLSFRRFWQELNAYCKHVGITDGWTRDYLSWRQVARLYSGIVRDCPLIMRKGYRFRHIAKVEITNCEPSKVVMGANPGDDYVGWKWTFTLSDGRSFEMPYTSGYGRVER
jgi:hypothetical protein